MADSKEYKIFKQFQAKVLDILSLEGTDLTMIGNAIVGAEFIQKEALPNILQKLPATASEQAYDLIRAVIAQVKVDPSKFEEFCNILSNDKVLAARVAENLRNKRDELQRQGKMRSEEKALTKNSVQALGILSSTSSNLQELGRLLVADKFIEEERMKAIISGLLKGRTEQARMMMSAVEAQLKHANTKFDDYLEALDQFMPLEDTVRRMRVCAHEDRAQPEPNDQVPSQHEATDNEFPCLILDEMGAWQQKAFKQKLHDEYRAIRNKFDILVVSTQDELNRRSSMTPKRLKESALFKDLGYKAMKNAGDFGSIFTVLKENYCWTWFHFDTLKDIIALCLPNGFQKLDDYCKEFESYFRRSLFECPNKIGKYSKKYSKPLFFVVDDAVFKNSNMNRYRRDFETALVTILNIKRNLVLLTCSQAGLGYSHSTDQGARLIHVKEPSFEQDSYSTDATFHLSPSDYLREEYSRALEEGPSVPSRHMRLMLIGPAGVGKTSLLYNLMRKELGEANSTKLAETHELRTETVMLQSGENEIGWYKVDDLDEKQIEEIAKLLHLTIEQATPDTSSKSSSDDSAEPLPESSKKESESHSVVNPVDETEQQVPESSIKGMEVEVSPIHKVVDQKVIDIHAKTVDEVLSKALGSSLDSKKSDMFLHVWDCGGQPVYMNALPAFVSAATIYLLVFDANKTLNSKVEVAWHKDGKKYVTATLSISYSDLLKQWMSAIDSYAPRNNKVFQKIPEPHVIIVGTHKETAVLSEEAIVEEFRCKSYLKILKKIVFVENTDQNSQDFSDLKTSIQKVLNNFVVPTPAKWALFRKVLSKFAGDNPVVPFDVAVTIGEQCKIPAETMPRVLEFYHELGVFLFYPKMEYVIANPGFLVKKLGCLLSHEKYLKENVPPCRADSVALLCEHGILLDDFCKAVCGEDHYKMVVDILTKFFLATEVKAADVRTNLQEYSHIVNDKSCVYFVPALYSQVQSENPEQQQYPLSTGTLCVRIPELNYLPPGFFPQLVVALTKNEDFEIILSNLNVSYNTVVFDYKNHFSVTVSAKSNSYIEVTLNREEVRNESEPFFVDACHELFSAIFHSTEVLPLKEMFSHSYIVQAMLLCQRKQCNVFPITDSQSIETKIYKPCRNCRNKISSEARLWLDLPKATGATNDILEDVLEQIKAEVDSASFWELVKWLELPGYEEGQNNVKVYFQSLLEELELEGKSPDRYLIYHLMRLNFNPRYIKQIRDPEFNKKVKQQGGHQDKEVTTLANMAPRQTREPSPTAPEPKRKTTGGKSVELLTLEQCLPTIQNFLSGGAVDLRWFAGKLTEKGLIHRQAADAILQGTTNMKIACGLMNAVVAQVVVDKEKYHRFCSILHDEGTLSGLDKMLTETYDRIVSTASD